MMNLNEENIPQFMSLDEVAQHLRVSKRTIYKYIEREDNPLPVVYLSDRVIRVPWHQFQIWIEGLKEKIEEV